MPQTFEGEDDSAGKAPRVLVRALALLARKSRSVAMLRRLLAAEGFSEGEIDDACRQVQAYGYLSDSRLAESVGHAASRRGKGPKWVQEALAQRAVASPEAGAAIREAKAREGEDAYGALARRFARLGPVHDPKTQARAMRFLLGRGFSLSAARAAFRQCQREQQSEPDPTTPAQ